MIIAVGSDHAGYEGNPPHFKPAIIEHLTDLGHHVLDFGTNGPESVDYPDFADKVAQTILAGDAERGVLLCGTGIGVSIGANRHPGIRAAVATTPLMAELARTHNDANVLCLGRRITTLEDCLHFIDIWLDTAFSEGERHRRRIKKLG